MQCQLQMQDLKETREQKQEVTQQCITSCLRSYVTKGGGEALQGITGQGIGL